MDEGSSQLVGRRPTELDAGAAVAEHAPDWRRRFRLQVVVTDLAVVVSVVALVAVARTHLGPSPWTAADAAASGAVVAVLTGTALPAFGCWDVGVLARGRVESVRLVRALAAAAVVASLLALAMKDATFRPWVFVVLPLLAVALVLARHVQRARLRRARRRGRHRARVLVVGTDRAVRDIVERSRRVPEYGWLVVAACVPAPMDCRQAPFVPVVGGTDDVVTSACQESIDVVAVTPGVLDPRSLHRLACALEGSGRELVVDPGLMEVSSGRVRMELMDGLPMLRVEEPRWRGHARWSKSAMDRLVALVMVVLLALVLVGIGIAVLSDGGPVLFRQVRVGRNGVPFQMLKFRSMRINADRLLSDLLNERGGAQDGAGPLFKLKGDPRVTRVGRILRRYSLDELPQLFNVLGGSMSLVGPRPPLPSEVKLYADDTRRRFVVQPGMTGLWQVSGRSDLTWEESVRLDLRYVEHWSPGLDLKILARTLRAVVGGRGAY